jgi:RNA polymerase sigma-70 factor (ECF subfamily)
MTHPDNNPPLSLEQKMRLAQRGNSDMYESLLREIAPIIRQMVSGRIRNREDAEEVVQEVLIAIHNSGHTYNTERPFLPWMRAIANHKLNDHFRRVYRDNAHLSMLKREVDAESIAKKSSPDVTASAHASELLDDLMRSLPERQHEIVRLMKLDGLSVRETAERLNMSVPAVKVAAHRAYKLLRKMAGGRE